MTIINDFGKRRETPCSDCDADGHCTMNCGPAVRPPRPEIGQHVQIKSTSKSHHRGRKGIVVNGEQFISQFTGSPRAQLAPELCVCIHLFPTTERQKKEGSPMVMVFPDEVSVIVMSPAEAAARKAGWERQDSHFTRAGVSIAYVDWATLCREEGIEVS